MREPLWWGMEGQYDMSVRRATMGDKLLDSYIYKTVDERDLTVAISYPDDWRPGDRRPAVVFFFGGAWEGGTTAQFLPQAEYFAQRGLVCVRVDYRVRSSDGVSPDKSCEMRPAEISSARAKSALVVSACFSHSSSFMERSFSRTKGCREGALVSQGTKKRSLSKAPFRRFSCRYLL